MSKLQCRYCNTTKRRGNKDFKNQQSLSDHERICRKKFTGRYSQSTLLQKPTVVVDKYYPRLACDYCGRTNDSWGEPFTNDTLIEHEYDCEMMIEYFLQVYGRLPQDWELPPDDRHHNDSGYSRSNWKEWEGDNEPDISEEITAKSFLPVSDLPYATAGKIPKELFFTQ